MVHHYTPKGWISKGDTSGDGGMTRLEGFEKRLDRFEKTTGDDASCVEKADCSVHYAAVTARRSRGRRGDRVLSSFLWYGLSKEPLGTRVQPFLVRHPALSAQ